MRDGHEVGMENHSQGLDILCGSGLMRGETFECISDVETHPN